MIATMSGPVDWRARLAHGLTRVLAAPLRHRYGGAVPMELLATVEIDQIATSRGRFNTLSWGDGAPAVVLLHGLNANARYWEGTACALHQGIARRVLAFDQRGHGGTGPLPGGYGLEETRADLLAWLDALALDQIDLVGHSWGGKVAADFAAAFPHRVRRLVLVDPVPPEGLDGLLDGATGFRRAIFAPERGPFRSDELGRAHRTISWLRHAEPWMHAAFDANFTTAEDGTIQHVLVEEAFDAIYDEVLRQPMQIALTGVSMPALLIRASFSVMPFSSQVKRLSAQIPRLETMRLAGEHSLHATNPVGLAQALRRFLAG